MQQIDILAVVGPTACGKTRRAVSLARRLDGEIISGDSRQVYRGMSIGTGKDLVEYGDVPYHLIDIRDAGYKYNLHEFISDYHAAVADITSRGKLPILCGGTGMYVESALSGLKLPEVPENPVLRKNLEHHTLAELTEILKRYKTLHNTTDVDTAKRAIRAIEIEEYYREHPDLAKLADRNSATPPRSLIIGVDIPREDRRHRISQRLEARLDEGMADEVRALLDSGIPAEDLIYYGLEYKFVTQYVTGQTTREQMLHDLEIAIHQFAKRQMTWFRGMERRGFTIHWIPYNLDDEKFNDAVIKLLETS